MTVHRNTRLVSGAVGAACATVLAIGPAMAASLPGAPWLSDPKLQGPEGEAHFAEFQSNCVATHGDFDAVKQIATREGWAAGKPITDGEHEIGLAWSYKKGERTFHVIASVETSHDKEKPEFDGLPVHECFVSTKMSADSGAIGGMNALLQSPGCGTGEVPGIYESVHWNARGKNYVLSYNFLRMGRSAAERQDMLSLIYLGSDQTLATLDLHKVC